MSLASEQADVMIDEGTRTTSAVIARMAINQLYALAITGANWGAFPGHRWPENRCDFAVAERIEGLSYAPLDTDEQILTVERELESLGESARREWQEAFRAGWRARREEDGTMEDVMHEFGQRFRRVASCAATALYHIRRGAYVEANHAARRAALAALPVMR